ncbi:hypothetical protein HQ32_00591 [Prauserella sp. Am3]|nr:hypothetical protein HQ32_00591 [Prauserella sp. Am3]
MLWLFGQIWLWLLIAFALGALSTALILRPPQRSPRADVEATPDVPARAGAGDPAREHPGTALLPPVSAEEQTGMLPATGTLPGEDPEAEHGESHRAHGRHAGSRAAHRTGRTRAPRTPDVERTQAGDSGRADEGEVLGSLDEWAGTGRTSGTLPPRRAWHARNEWPDEADVHATEHDIPRSGG